MKHTLDLEIEAARRWIDEGCHHCGVRQILERGLEYVEAVNRAGLPPDLTTGDSLYEFLCDAATTAAWSKTFVQPTL